MRPIDDRQSVPLDLRAWKSVWVADLDRVAARRRWGLALSAVGWIHLAVFLTCEWMYVHGDRRAIAYVALWGLELAAVVWTLRKIAGRGWTKSTPMAGLVSRVWATFLILSFNLASLNTLTGLDHEWFRPALCTLSTFGFATMAYLINLRFFIPAVQMYCTGLLMVRYPLHSYLIYGLSWWLALQLIGGMLERRRLTRFAPVIGSWKGRRAIRHRPAPRARRPALPDSVVSERGLDARSLF
jgi:hypothetical protein